MRTKDLALGGILTALSVVILYISYILPTSQLTMFALATFVVILGYIRGSLKTATLIYLSTSLLCFLLIPLQVTIVYVLFFGNYGIVKSFIESQNKYLLEYILKLIYFNVVGFLDLYLTYTLFGYTIFDGILITLSGLAPSLGLSMHLLIIWAILQVIFLVFDYAINLLIDEYYKKFSRI
ncbi:MAG: hypothetical protein ATN36_01425 [Epulopiscium sp. Nele67-Bin005]|nr:MAG: hypothetical protein ATN36_01425 [Epulopiscium sp. Nele67-Bin005]